MLKPLFLADYLLNYPFLICTKNFRKQLIKNTQIVNAAFKPVESEKIIK